MAWHPHPPYPPPWGSLPSPRAQASWPQTHQGPCSPRSPCPPTPFANKGQVPLWGPSHLHDKNLPDSTLPLLTGRGCPHLCRPPVTGTSRATLTRPKTSRGWWIRISVALRRHLAYGRPQRRAPWAAYLTTGPRGVAPAPQGDTRHPGPSRRS